MCGITGAVFLKGVDRSEEMLKQIRFVFNELFVNTQVRGEHATGLVHFKRSGGYDFHKAAKSSQDMVTNDETYNQIIDGMGNDTFSVIGHTRWYTKGLPANNDNNHPFNIGNVVGVHNGTITNDDALFKKHKKDFKRLAQVDSEIIYQLINHYNRDKITFDGLKLALEKSLLRGLFALAFAHKNQPNLVHLIKQEKPMNLAYWAEAGVVFFNSQEDLIENAFDSLTRIGRTLGFAANATVEFSTMKEDTYITLDANAETLQDMVSDPVKFYILSSNVKTYTANTGNFGKNYGTTGGNSLARTITAKDSIGRVIEGELDETTGEIILFTSSQIAGVSEDDGSEMADNDLSDPVCVECQEWLTDGEINASYNASNPKNDMVCRTCYEEACATALISK